LSENEHRVLIKNKCNHAINHRSGNNNTVNQQS